MLPAMDPAELERRAAELRIVHLWLEQTLRAVEMTIRTMELQARTIRFFTGGLSG